MANSRSVESSDRLFLARKNIKDAEQKRRSMAMRRFFDGCGRLPHHWMASATSDGGDPSRLLADRVNPKSASHQEENQSPSLPREMRYAVGAVSEGRRAS